MKLYASSSGMKHKLSQRKRGRTPFIIYLAHFKSPLIYVILAAGIISFILGECNDVYIIP